MEFSFASLAPSKNTPDTAYTGILLIDGVPLLNVTKTVEMDLPKLDYVVNADKPTERWGAAEAQVKAMGHEHLWAFVASFYAENMAKRAGEIQHAQKMSEIKKLCLQALVIKLPRHEEGEYMLSYEAPSVTASKGMGAAGKQAAKLASAVGSEAHKAAVRALYAEIMGDVFAAQIEFYNDRFAVEQGKLSIAA